MSNFSMKTYKEISKLRHYLFDTYEYKKLPVFYEYYPYRKNSSFCVTAFGSTEEDLREMKCFTAYLFITKEFHELWVL